jgi:preprotein translocase subunit SecY
MGGIVKQVMLMGIGGGITLLILAIIRQFSHRKTPPTQTDTA